MRAGITVELSAADRQQLAVIVADRNSPQKHVWRAQIVLLTADGCGTAEIMRRTDTSKTAVWRWQERFMTDGVAGLLRDKTRPSRIPPLGTAVEQHVVACTLTDPPGETTHWTAGAMAKATGISVSSVQRIWRKHGLQPHRTRQFKLSNDPQFAAKLHEIVGLYVDPPAHTVVLSIDEKRSHGVEAIPLGQSEVAIAHLEAAHVSYRSAVRSTDPHPNGSWGDFRFNGAESHELVAHITLSRRWGKDVQACVAQRRRRWTVGEAFSARGEGSSSDRAGRSKHRDPRGRHGRLLDPPPVAGERD
jgi:transposase